MACLVQQQHRRFTWTVIALLALSAPVYAQSTDAARASDLKKQGDELVHAAKYREALQAYDDSFAIVANPAIHYNRARAFQLLGDYPAALDAFDKFVATAPADLKAKVPNLDRMIAEVAAHVATLVIKCPVDGATVAVGGKAIGTTPLSQPLHLLPGDVTITAAAPGYVNFTQETTLAAGESATIDLNLRKAAAAQTTTVPEPTPDEPNPTEPSKTQKPAPMSTSSSGSGWRTLGFLSGGVGIASLGTGMVFFGLALSDKGKADSHCPRKVCDATGRKSINEAQTFATASTALVIVGAVGLALSVTSFIVAPKKSPVQARVFIGPGFGAIGGAF